MAGEKARKELLELIDHKAFDPVIKADPGDYDENEQEKLRGLQDTTRKTKKSYHEENTASAVYESYKNDLSSDSAKKVQKELKALGLPVLPDIKEEVEKKARELDVS